MGRRHAIGAVDDVVAEVRRWSRLARTRGIDPVPIFFADDEFNLPDEGTRSRCSRRSSTRSWRRTSPGGRTSTRRRSRTASPSSRRPTHGFVSVTVDSAADAVLARAGKPFRRRHLDALLERVHGGARRAHGARPHLRPAGRDRGDGRRDHRLRARAAGRPGGRLRRRRPRLPEHAAGRRSPSEEPQHLYGARARGWPSRRSTRAVGDPRALARELEAGVRRPAERRAHGRRLPPLDARALARLPRRAGRRPPRRGTRALDRAAREPGAGGGPHARGVPAHRPLARALRPRRRRGGPAAPRRPAARRVQLRPAARPGRVRRDGPRPGPAPAAADVVAPGLRRAPTGCGAASRAGRARCRAGCPAASRAGAPPPGRRRRRGR